MKKKKMKFTSIMLSLAVCICLLVRPAYAQADSQTIYTYTESFEDGSYIVEELQVSDPGQSGVSLLSTTKTKSATRTRTYYNNSNKKCWAFSLSGTFQYNGSTAKATAASCSYTIYVSSWKCSSKTATYSGSTATGSAVFKSPTTSVTAKLGLKCSASGTISSVN